MDAKVSLKQLQSIVMHRRMCIADVIPGGLFGAHKYISIDSRSDLDRLAARLGVTAACLLKNDTNNGKESERVKLVRYCDCQHLEKHINGDLKYHYRRLLTVAADPHLTVLKTTVYPSKNSGFELNFGHRPKEFILVIDGEITLHWKGKDNQTRSSIMREGDSAFINAWVRHALEANVRPAEILAVDYI